VKRSPFLFPMPPPPFPDDPNLVINMGALHIVSGHIGAANTNGGV